MIFIEIMIGVLVALAALETVRYRMARGGGDEMPYPRRRLTRRLAIAAFFIAILLIIACGEPSWGPWGKIAYLSSILLLTLVGIGFVGRELVATSREALVQKEDFNRHVARNLAQIIEKAKKNQNGASAPPTNDDEAPRR